jgi:acylphosphatase
VQGVFFRAYTQEAAQKEGVSGWVRNLPDSRVEAVFEGREDDVDRMVSWCYKGSPMSRVDQVDVKEETFTGELRSFEIRY